MLDQSMLQVAVIGLVGAFVIGTLLWQWWSGALTEATSTAPVGAVVGRTGLRRVETIREIGRRRRSGSRRAA